jgi:hypothetical protein
MRSDIQMFRILLSHRSVFRFIPVLVTAAFSKHQQHWGRKLQSAGSLRLLLQPPIVRSWLSTAIVAAALAETLARNGASRDGLGSIVKKAEAQIGQLGWAVLRERPTPIRLTLVVTTGIQ